MKWRRTEHETIAENEKQSPLFIPMQHPPLSRLHYIPLDLLSIYYRTRLPVRLRKWLSWAIRTMNEWMNGWKPEREGIRFGSGDGALTLTLTSSELPLRLTLTSQLYEMKWDETKNAIFSLFLPIHSFCDFCFLCSISIVVVAFVLCFCRLFLFAAWFDAIECLRQCVRPR